MRECSPVVQVLKKCHWVCTSSEETICEFGSLYNHYCFLQYIYGVIISVGMINRLINHFSFQI